MPEAVTHPIPQELTAFGLGKLPEHAAAERMAVALDRKTIGKFDWYAWGVELLLANQQADGSWKGDYAECGADTCFALLFLNRSNLTPDLTATLKGKGKDPD